MKKCTLRRTQQRLIRIHKDKEPYVQDDMSLFLLDML